LGKHNQLAVNELFESLDYLYWIHILLYKIIENYILWNYSLKINLSYLAIDELIRFVTKLSSHLMEGKPLAICHHIPNVYSLGLAFFEYCTQR